MALTATPVCEFGRPAIDFQLPGVDGQSYDLARARGPNGLLIMFICNHCPYVKAIRDKLIRDARDLQALGIGVVAINSNDATSYPEDSFPKMKEEAARFNYPFAYLWDEDQSVARAYGAVCTPDFFGYNADLLLQYRGRLDDAGARADAGSRPRELYDGMAAVARSGHGPQQQQPSMGCSIKWKQA